MRAPVPRTGRTIARPFPTTTNTGKILKHLNMTKQQLAAETGINERRLTEILAGRTALTYDTRTRIAAALEVNPDLL